MTSGPANFTAQDDVIINKQEIVYQGHFCLYKFTLKHRLFNGAWSKEISREVLERGKAAGVLLYDPDRHQFVLIEQFRPGTLGYTSNPWLLELVAGIIDPGEKALEVAIRETQEEAGLIPLHIIPICEYWVSPGGTSEKITLFCARVDASNAGGIHGLAEEGEDIRVLVYDVEEIYRMLEKGEISNAPILIALQWFKLNEANVRKQFI